MAIYLHSSFGEGKRRLTAKLCEQRSQYDAALKIYQGLLRLVPSHPQVNGLKGALLIQMGRPAQAIQPLEIAWSLNPESPSTGCDWWRLATAVGV